MSGSPTRLSDTMRRWASLLSLLSAAIAADTRAQPEPADSQPPPSERALPDGGDVVDAELERWLAEPIPEAELASDRPSLSLYGFGDMTVMKAFPSRDLGVFPPKSVVMAIGNVNLYAAADLTHGFSSLLEVRFSLLPNGALDPATLQTISTTTLDYADWNRQVQWGGIVLERFQLDYSYHSLLNVRLGMWLTPYGIWNVDHGSPTVIPAMKPYAIGEQLFPTRQTGFQLFGSHLVGNTTLGYALTLSNGRGDIQQLDLDTNKAVGGRLFLSYAELGTLTLGFSWYTGLATRGQRISVTPGNPPRFANTPDESFKELSFAGDVLWDFRDLRLQAEVISSQRLYRDDARRLASGLGTRSGFLPDHLAWGTYVLAAYRLPWLNIMPYVLWEWFDRGYARSQLIVFGGNTVNVLAVAGGLNVRPIPQVALKLQYSHITFPGAEMRFKIPNLSFQAAWAF